MMYMDACEIADEEKPLGAMQTRKRCRSTDVLPA
jgi:hypothetical protein